ncbi:MAG: hypothetical protein HYR71_01825 [Chloroflexi bacterium]|nr:hypothetical protein [Chloroflexota bacterium]
MPRWLTPNLLWIITPLVMVVSLMAGISSASAEQALDGESSGLRPRSLAFRGEVTQVLLQARSVVVQTKRGRVVTVMLKASTQIKASAQHIRPADIKVGDHVLIVGRPRGTQALDASTLTILRKAGQGARASPNPKG